MRALPLLLLLAAGVASAQDAGFTASITLRETARVKRCGRARGDVPVRLDVAPDGSWSLDVPDDGILLGSSEPRGRRGTKLVLTPDTTAFAALGARLDRTQAAVCDPPKTLGAVTLRSFVVKLNRRRTKARLRLKAQAMLDDGTYVVLAWRGGGLAEPVAPVTTTTIVSSSTTSTSLSTSTSTTLPCGAIDLGSTVPLTIVGTTSGAGNDVAPDDGCFAVGVPPSNGEDVLYEWTAPSSGTFVFDTLTPGIDTVVYAFAGCGGPELVCNDDFTYPPDGNSGSFIGVDMTAGEHIVVAVDSYATSGGFTLNVAGPVAGGNCCAQRPTGGCELPAVASCLCEVDGPCCSAMWDRLCVAEAISFCALSCE